MIQRYSGKPWPWQDSDRGAMTAILGGLGAAVFFATATLRSSRSSRMLSPSSVLTWVMLTGLVLRPCCSP